MISKLAKAHPRPLFSAVIFTYEAGKTDLLLVCDHGSLARLQVPVCSGYDLCRSG